MKLKGVNILAVVSEDFEDLEFWVPVMRLREEGALVTIAGIEKDKEYHGKYGVPVISEETFIGMTHEGYHGILIPGGWSPDKLRRYPELLEIIRGMDREGKIIAQICHAPWVTISAGVVKGRNVTSTPGIKDDLINAGAVWHDLPVVVDDNFVSSRRPPDIPDYMRELVKALERFV